ncbi:hypothetical protein EDB92DRAFT_1936585 [Lactarius akahatsu]|uniref:Uncharacterized protein n=1 Tax=Lactarius akahatsu TaxID=416441 RepID=A0AAD4Q788_9AGAM|nr:hypothetical protein EDB92DRAFT_1936585 [Lactarius akahatsu]
MRYVVFLGAPSPSSTSTSSDDGRSSYQWRTVTPTPDPSQAQLSKKMSLELLSNMYPSSALDAASRRISAMYENIIFGDEDEDEGDTQVVEEDLTRDIRDRTTWVPTTQAEGRSEFASRPPLDASTSHMQSPLEDLETQDSYYYSDTSSIARALSALASANGNVCLLLTVLEVDGPDGVTVRRGPDTGRAISVLRLILGDETSTICKLTAWREIAETWGGATQAVGMRRGDVVYFETRDDGVAPTLALTASPNLRSRAEICYRTMPRTSVPADLRLRPDLRLGTSDAAVRRVAAVVTWFERMAGFSFGIQGARLAAQRLHETGVIHYSMEVAATCRL